MTETLFSYSVDEDEGTLVISIRGALADQAIRHLREGMATGSAPFGALLSPLFPIGRLLSGAVEFRSEGGQMVSPQIDETALDQQVQQTFAAFREQMDEFRAAVQRLVAERSAGEEGAASSAA